MRRLVALSIIVLMLACVGTTGGALVDFPAAASGPSDAQKPLTFDTDRGWHVVLTQATLHIGAIYLDQSAPVSGSQGTACILPGIYSAEVTSGRDVDLLDPAPQMFATQGHGTTSTSLVGQVWLTGGDINEITDPTPILVVAGTATQGATSIAFEGKLTISSNRASTSQPAGASPICKQRIVSPIPVNLAAQGSGGLLLRVDPRLLFVNVDFSQLTQFSSTYGFSDDPSSDDYTQPSINLWQNLHASSALYQFSWSESL